VTDHSGATRLLTVLRQTAGALGDTHNSPTLTARATQMGMIIGTAAYIGEFYSMQAVPGAAQQTSIQLRTRWFEEVERVVRR
jgi:hypothetical protein